MSHYLFRFVQQEYSYPLVSGYIFYFFDYFSSSLLIFQGMLAQLFETVHLMKGIYHFKTLLKKIEKTQHKFSLKELEKMGLFYTSLSDENIKHFSKV